MTTQDQAIFQRYKPFRNAVRELPTGDSLRIIHAYMLHLQFKVPLPSEYQVAREFTSVASRPDKTTWISEFELETLCREVILQGMEAGTSPKTLQDWDTLARVMNKLKGLEEFIADRFLSPDLIMQELHRTAHRQFPWQMSRPTAVNMTRYFMIYSNPGLHDIIQAATRLKVKELFLMGMALLGKFLTTVAVVYPPTLQITGLSRDILDRFLHHFSVPSSVLKQKLKAEQQMNDRFAYAYSSLRAYPLVRIFYEGHDSLVCPMPTLLFWRFTSGVYYEICNEPTFDNAFGAAFQGYVGQVLGKAISGRNLRIYPEKEYRVGKDLKRSVDWIMAQEKAALFIEAKTKRLALEARVEIGCQHTLEVELDKMAAMIVQVYKSVKDYREGHYLDFPHDPDRRIYPVVVTLEDWFLIGPGIMGQLREKVSIRLQKSGLPLDWLAMMPYTVCAIHELEQTIQVMDVVGIEAVMAGKVTQEKQEWSLESYIRNAFKGETDNARFLFEDEYRSLNIGAPVQE